MSGSGGGFDLNAFNPFDDWKHKGGLDKFASLAGLPIGSAIASPKWIKAHPREAAAAAVVAASVFTGGAAAGAWGGAAGAGAGGTALAGEGAALGGTAAAGGAAGGTAGLFGPTTAGAGLLGSYAAPAAATPFITGGGGATLAGMGAGTAGMFGPGATAAGLESLPAASSGASSGNAFDGLMKIQKLMNLTQQQPQSTTQSQRPQAGPQTDPMEYLRRIYAMQNGGKS